MCGMRRDFIFEAADESRAKRDKKNMVLKIISGAKPYTNLYIKL